jgi:MFS family permease
MRFGPPVRLLLLASFVVTASRALTLPFLAVYLIKTFTLKPVEVGAMLTASLALATLAGVYGGYLVDRSDKLRLLVVSVLVAALTAAALPLLHNASMTVLVLTISSAATSLIDIAIKSSFAQLLNEDERLKAFSARYLINNVAYAVGPMAGTALLAAMGESWLFYSAGVLCLLTLAPLLPLYLAGIKLPAVGAQAGMDFAGTLQVLRSDRRLLVFTAAGILCALVYGRFSAYLSQYLTVVIDADTAYRMMGYLITTNALVVMGLQYLLGTRIQRSTILLWQAIASLLFICALLGFMVSTALSVWMIAMVLFTLGEIVAVPASYLFVDYIAPDHMKGSYYAAENLAGLGSAASPLVCGLLLETGAPLSMFWMLIACTAVSLLLYAAGQRIQPTRAMAADRPRVE